MAVPYNPAFCVAKSCPNLVHRDLCSVEECIYNSKWIVYWELFNEYPPGEAE